jgi:transposase-like protein
MSVAAWCGKHGVSAPSFYVWRQRLAKRGAARKSGQLPLVPVEIISPASVRSVVVLEIEWSSQVTVRVRSGCEPELLRQVLAMLDPDGRGAEGC